MKSLFCLVALIVSFSNVSSAMAFQAANFELASSIKGACNYQRGTDGSSADCLSRGLDWVVRLSEGAQISAEGIAKDICTSSAETELNAYECILRFSAVSTDRELRETVRNCSAQPKQKGFTASGVYAKKIACLLY